MKQRLSKRWQIILWTLGIFFLIGSIAYQYFPEYFGLVILFFYIIPSNSFIAIPHEPIIIFYGKLYGAVITTLVATVPTIIGCYIDYEVLLPVFKRTRLRKIKDTRLYINTVRYFNKAPFMTNAVAAISPVPFYPVRILSIVSGYPAWKYTAAVVLGRIPRYYVLALTGALINIPNWLIALFFAFLIIPTLSRKLTSRRFAQQPQAPQLELNLVENVEGSFEAEHFSSK